MRANERLTALSPELALLVGRASVVDALLESTTSSSEPLADSDASVTMPVEPPDPGARAPHAHQGRGFHLHPEATRHV